MFKMRVTFCSSLEFNLERTYSPSAERYIHVKNNFYNSPAYLLTKILWLVVPYW